MRVFFAAFSVLGLVMMFSANVEAGILNSKHDLRLGSSGPSDPSLLGGDDTCIHCHTPHNPSGTGSKPLWHRGDPVTESFVMYGTTMGGNTTDPQPNQSSLRCLSCHDGVTAMDAYGGSTGTPEKILSSPYIIGVDGDLSDQHPVSISTAGMGESFASAEAAGLVFYETGGSSKVECGTCHDPHLTDNGKFLRISNVRSALCQVCHNK